MEITTRTWNRILSPQEIDELVTKLPQETWEEMTFGKSGTNMFGWPWSIPPKEKITEESLFGKNIHARPCPVCEGKKHGVDSCSKVDSVSYDDAGNIKAVKFAPAGDKSA